MSGVDIKKSYEEINSKIRQGKAVVVTADEMPGIVASEGVDGAFRKVDVVTTGTWTDAWPVKAGDRWTARFSSPLPSLSLTIV